MPSESFYPSLGLGNSFAFKFEDQKGRVHRFNCSTENLSELVSAVNQRIGTDCVQDNPQLMYEDDEGDRVLLSTDSDLTDAVSHARVAGWKVLRLHVYHSSVKQQTPPPADVSSIQKSGWVSLQTGVLASAVLLTGIGVMVYLKRSKS